MQHPLTRPMIELRWREEIAYQRVGRTRLRVGRAGDSELCVDDDWLSKRHLEVWFDDGLWARDCGSKNGTTLNEQPMEPGRDYPVAAGDVLSLGLRVQLRIAESGAWDWALSLLPALVGAASPRRRLELLVQQVQALTRAPVVWALRWSEAAPSVSLEDLIHLGDTSEVPDLKNLSRSILAQAQRQGSLWINDALAEPRFAEADSVVASGLRAVGCVPILEGLVLYLSDKRPKQPWDRSTCERIEALCRIVGALEVPGPAPQPREAQLVLPGIIARSQVMHDLAEQVRIFAPFRRSNILLLGEPGTGKTQLARAIHECSDVTGAFVHLNVPCLRRELLEAQLFGYEPGAFAGANRTEIGLVGRARDGTLFLDEIGDLPDELQSRLLQLLREKTYFRLGSSEVHRFNGRIIAATNRPIHDPEAMPSFRRDLFSRLAEVQLRVPPLRQRRDDIPALIQHFVDEFVDENREYLGGSMSVSPAVIALMKAATLEDNIAGLRSDVRAACMRAHRDGRLVRVDHYLAPGDPAPTAELGPEPHSFRQKVAHFERTLILRELDRTKGNKSEAARRLGLTRQALHRCLDRLGLFERTP